MSMEDLERLMSDLQKSPELMQEFRALGKSREGWVRWGQERGYRFSVEEAEGLAASRGELSDDELEQVAGGWDGTTDGTGGGG